MRGAYAQVQWVGPPGWRRIPLVTKILLVLSGSAYLAGVLFPVFAGALAADTARILGGLELWRLLTWPFAIVGVWNILFGLLLIWSFGSELEPEWGSRKFGLFSVLVPLIAGILGTAVTLVPKVGPALAFGLSGFLVALIMAWMLRGPSLPVHFFGILPMNRKIFALLTLVIVILSELEAARSFPRLIFALGGIPVAYLFSRPPGWLRGNPFRRNRFRVIQGDRDRYHYH
ncbi:MAG: rhomboid family intramembrane serine protease [Thermoanaerobaculia bacterium]|nr:rhomboid family intramembrane serine protease [Thermoanaerobaculia bacterium]